MLKLWTAVPLWFTTLAAVAAMLTGDQPGTPAARIVLQVLGGVSSLLGMGHSVFGAIVLTVGLIVATILYSIFALWIPSMRR